MSKEEANIVRILELCALAGRGISSFSRADMDELALRVSVIEANLPNRFTEIVKRLDSNFSNYSDSSVSEFGSRMGRILSLSREIELRDISSNNEDELLPTFTLDDDDRTRVLVLCEEMRRLVFSSTFFDHAHKRRLSNRISAIEKQVHQPKGLFDVILGGLSDVGEALGKFGNDVKPLTDRMSEVAQIAREGSKEYDSLPPPEVQKRLPPPEE